VGGEVSLLRGAYQQYPTVEEYSATCVFCIQTRSIDSLDENRNHKIIHSIQTVHFDRDSILSIQVMTITEMRKDKIFRETNLSGSISSLPY
jgi:hypothetical protein